MVDICAIMITSLLGILWRLSLMVGWDPVARYKLNAECGAAPANSVGVKKNNEIKMIWEMLFVTLLTIKLRRSWTDGISGYCETALPMFIFLFSCSFLVVFLVLHPLIKMHTPFEVLASAAVGLCSSVADDLFSSAKSKDMKSMRQRCQEARKKLHSALCDPETNILGGALAWFLNQYGSLRIVIGGPVFICL